MTYARTSPGGIDLATGRTAVEIPDQILFGRSAAMEAVRSRIEKAAQTNIPVLIVGEVGTRKDVIARNIHARSLSRNGPFVSVNCPGIPGALLESELFGYEEGAFAGAFAAKAGLVESATGGSLFLDSVGELEFSLQGKFLQFLKDHHFTRIGGHEMLCADLRIICAASRPLEEEIALGRFREDLFYRINVLTIEIPPLRERRVDIPDMVEFFLRVFAVEFSRSPRAMMPSTQQLLVAHDWPGNIRQLENVIKRYVIFDNEDAILANISAGGPAPPSPSAEASASLKEMTGRATRELERKVILETLAAYRWNRRRAAEALRISYRALLYKMKQAGLPAKRSDCSFPGERQQ